MDQPRPRRITQSSIRIVDTRGRPTVEKETLCVVDVAVVRFEKNGDLEFAGCVKREYVDWGIDRIPNFG